MIQSLTRGMRKVAAAAVALALFVAPSHAQGPSAVYVMGEDDYGDMKACNLTFASAISAVEAALRYNGVSVASREDAMSQRALRAYVNLIALNDPTGCAAYVKIEFSTSQFVNLPSSLGLGPGRYGLVKLCDNGSLFIGPAYDLQSRVNSVLRDFTDQCISTISKP